MTDPTWQVAHRGDWYHVSARATCPNCGAELEHTEVRRAAAGPPATPALAVPASPTGADLVAEGWPLPLVSHRCAG
ncbi:MAG: hypothetical protein ACRD0D_09620 [Acidimicrobiales bacterium]